VATDIGVAGIGLAQREEHRRQRERFRKLLKDGGLGRGKGGG
jgi:hypothetical protein